MNRKEPFREIPQAWQMEALPLDDAPVRFDRILARAKVMKQVLNRLLAAAKGDVPVLILGETGTGKDLVAESIHRRSRRKDGPFVVVNAGAIAKELVASELFGHEPGAFTGAVSRRQGKLAKAHGGTLFLDEINSLDMAAQATLLRVIEDGSYFPVGGDVARRCDVRVIAASNADLQALALNGGFRMDLFWRLEGFTLRLPALRERPGAVLMLAEQFLLEFKATHAHRVRHIRRDAARSLEAYAWPGNVRELKNVIQSAVLLAQGDEITPELLPPRVSGVEENLPGFHFPTGRTLRDLEAAYVAATLAECGNNKAAAAGLLGISRKALYEKLRRMQRT